MKRKFSNESVIELISRTAKFKFNPIPHIFIGTQQILIIGQHCYMPAIYCEKCQCYTGQHRDSFPQNKCHGTADHRRLTKNGKLMDSSYNNQYQRQVHPVVPVLLDFWQKSAFPGRKANRVNIEYCCLILVAIVPQRLRLLILCYWLFFWLHCLASSVNVSCYLSWMEVQPISASKSVRHCRRYFWRRFLFKRTGQCFFRSLILIGSTQLIVGSYWTCFGDASCL